MVVVLMVGFFKVGKNHELLIRDQATELRRTLTLEDSLNELEAILIQVLEPRLNRRGPNWIETEEFLQYFPSPEEGDEGVELDA